MSIVFKYKHSLERAYAPGIADSGENGEKGNKGIAGPCIYYVGYDLDNSYSINLALQKIENNLVLSDESSVTLPEGRTYKNNDLIISVSGQCYRLRTSSQRQMKFEIENIGQIIKNDINDPNPITNVYLVIFNGEPRYFNTHYRYAQNICVPPTNYTINSYNPENFLMDGIWMMPIVYSAEDLNVDIKVYYNLTKELTRNKLPNESEDSSRIKSLSFTKYLEFSNIPCSISGNGQNSVYFKPFYISNMALDRLEPTNKIEFTGITSSNTGNTANMLTYYRQGIDKDQNKNPSDYAVTFDPCTNGTYVHLNRNNTEYVYKIPDVSTNDASFGPAQNNSGLPTIDIETQQELLIDIGNKGLIKGAHLLETEPYHAGTTEQWSSVSSVHEAFETLARSFDIEVSYAKNGKLYSYTLENVKPIYDTELPEIFQSADVMTTLPPYSYIEDENELFTLLS